MEPTLQIENNNATLNATSAVSCSMLVGKNYLSFAITDILNNAIYLLKHFYFEEKVLGKNDFNAILSDPIFKQVNHIKIAIDTTKSTLVPIDLFSHECAQVYFDLMYDLSAEEELHSQKLDSKMVSVFSLKKATVSFLSATFNNVTFYDASSCLLNVYPACLTDHDTHTFFVCVKDDCATMSVYYKKQLLLHQVYAEIADSDMTYYIANFISVHQLNIDSVLIQFHGESKRLQIVFDEVSDYYPNTTYCSRIPALNYPESLLAHPTHYFFNLLSVVLCA